MQNGIRLRPPQRAALKSLDEAKGNGEKSSMVVMPSGLGKTLVGAVDSLKGKRILWIAQRSELLRQAEKTFVKCGIDWNDIAIQCLQYKRNNMKTARILLTTHLTGKKIMHKFKRNHFGL